MNHRPRIVHVYKDVYPPVEGGIERIIHWMARLTADEFDVRVIVAARGRRGGVRFIAVPAEEKIKNTGGGGIPVRELPSWGRAMSTPLAPGFVAALRTSGADLFHFHIPHPTGEAAWLLSGLAGGRRATPAVATYHSDVVRQRAAMIFYAPVFRAFLHRLRLIMPTSQRYLETSPFLIPLRERCRVVPLGYPLEAYAATPEIAARAAVLRQQWGDYVFFLGCLRAYKGLPFLLEALARLPEARCVIAGEGAERDRLERRAAELGLGERVHFLGRVDEAEAVALLHGAAMFVLPAHQRSEAFGLCQIEAMACGLPVVSTDLPTGVPEVNEDGVSGLSVPPADSAALADAIGRLLADPALRQRLGEGGRRRAWEHYHARTMAERLKGVYREALTREKL